MAPVAYETAAEALKARLTPEAFGHSERVAETAASLATIYAADPEEAQLAGLLHDWDRERDRGEILEAAMDAGLRVTPTDVAKPRLLHAETGAASLVEELPGLPDSVLSAVARHTLGDVEMSDLDRIVYIADMIEPGRDFPGVDDLREAVGSVSLNALFALCYRHTLLYLIEEGRPIHPRTVDVWNSLVARDLT
jgi:predicted HD superfamily hydrolase involved in NAD metabolism